MALNDPARATSGFLTRSHGLLIGGRWVEAQGGERIDVFDPATGRKISDIADASVDDVDRAVAAAREAFDRGSWASMKPSARGRIIYRIAELMEAAADELAELETLDNGKPIKFARGEVFAAAGAVRYYAGWADKIHGTTHSISLPGDYHSYTLKEPLGVAALITPWNYPVVMAAMKIAPALAAGCTGVLKPAEDTSLTALRLGELMLEAGLPDGVINIVTGHGRTAGAALVAHPGVDKISFTGSTVTGRAIAQAAGANLKKVSLELGGKSPNIIMADADLEKAIPGSAMGIFHNCGQTCTAPSRLYVHEDVHDQVVAGIAAVGRGLKIGPGLDPESDLGPLVSQRQFDRVTGYIEAGRAEGAEIVAGGTRHGNEGYFLEPTVITRTNNKMKIVREEIFGPVLAVQTFSDLDEIVERANDNEYGLAAFIWTRELSAAHNLARRIRAGSIGINTSMAADWDLPLGGYKQSGIGRENGYEGLEQYLQIKSVVAGI